MDITINELGQLTPDSYILLDMRGDVEVGHGIIPGAIHMSKEEILEKYSGGLVKADEAEAAEREDSAEKKLIIYCARGRISQELAEELRDRGYDAYSLKGGYTSWLLNEMKNQQADEVCAQVEKSIRKKFRKNIWCKFTKAINQYELVKEGDCIAVCISGGKDSMLMAKLFQELKLHNKFPFEVKFVVMDPGYSPENRKVIEENARKLKIPIHIFESDIFESVYHIEKSPCYLCARMRRGYLYNFAKELGCNKIALGHHYDDVIETILMGMLYGAQIQCACKFTDTCTTCNNEENQSKRVEIKQLIAEIKKKNPYVEAHIFKSVENVNIETVIAYKKDGVKHHFLDNYDL